MTVKLFTDDRIAETSSKGNQEKWLDKGLWYKVDQFGYEALTEAFTSKLLEYSNIEKDTPFTFVRYDIQKVNVHGFERVACVSKNFLNENQSLITLNGLFKKYYTGSLKSKLSKLSSDKKRIMYLVDFTKEITGLKDFDKYLTLLFEIDSFILNDDRHLNNIAVIEDSGKFLYCPIFDNGAGLLSNIQILRTDIEPKGLMASIKSSPLGMTFNRELNTVRNLYGGIIKLPKFKKEQLSDILQPMLEYYPQRDQGIISDRVIECITQRQKYFNLK